MVGVDVGLGEMVGVAVGVCVLVAVGVLVGVVVGVLVGVEVKVRVGVSVGVAVGVEVAVAVLLAVGVGVRVAVRVGVLVAVGVDVGVGARMVIDSAADRFGTVVPSIAVAPTTRAVLAAGLHAATAVRLMVTAVLTPAASGPRLFQVTVLPDCAFGMGVAEPKPKQPLWKTSVSGTDVRFSVPVLASTME